MSKVALVSGILCIVLAVVIFIFAEGLRRWYSGIFFALIGVVMMLGSMRHRRSADQQDSLSE
jgi:Flp pilus assembly protein TadB